MSHIVHVISYVERGIIVYLCNYMMRLHVNVYGNSQHCSLAVVIQYFLYNTNSGFVFHF